MATILRLAAPGEIQLETEGLRVSIDGVEEPDQRWTLDAGTHLVLAFASHLFGHLKELSLRFVAPPDGLSLKNICHPSSPNPWCWINLPAFTYRQKDLQVSFTFNEDPVIGRLVEAYNNAITGYLADIKDEYEFLETLVRYSRCPKTEEMFVTDSHWKFMARQPFGPAGELVVNPGGLVHGSAGVTTIYPSPDGDIELVYDLGAQCVGYLDFDLTADEGVEVDFYEVEYITPEGVVQHTWANRNGMRYITRQGDNRFTSLKRRSGRYLFITLRNQRAPVRFRHIKIIESTYPVEPVGKFACSDERLERIWEISERTLKLCMEDTFTDCPLYEQTLWVGDARNEALYAFNLYGADDLARRCIRLAALSLERYPITGCQVPSSWEILLPAWSFLWTISVWEEYFYAGDPAYLAQTWPWVVRNLQGAEGLLDEHGLFSGPFWNLFDWSGADDRQNVVLHNSMLMTGAIQAAQKMAEVLSDTERIAWLTQMHERLVGAINRWWDPQKHAYPDSLHADGSPSPVVSIHTSFLALLYGIATPEIAPQALANTLTPPPGMVIIGSPFAMQFYYETLEKLGHQDEILASIYANYMPMLDAGSTTVWEVFPGGTNRPDGFPTRSHCHAWSAAPLYFLPRLVLGVRQVEAGGAAFEISPRPGNLAWARGSMATGRGTLAVAWERTGDRLRLHIQASEGVSVRVVTNPTLAGLEIEIDS